MADRLDYDPKENLVALALRRLAERFLETGYHWLIREDAVREVDGVLPGRDFSRSLYRGMVDEGVLLEDMRVSCGGDSREIVSVAFERFADHVVAEAIILQHLDRIGRRGYSKTCLGSGGTAPGGSSVFQSPNDAIDRQEQLLSQHCERRRFVPKE